MQDQHLHGGDTVNISGYEGDKAAEVETWSGVEDENKLSPQLP